MKRNTIIGLFFLFFCFFCTSKTDASVVFKTYTREYTVEEDFVQINEYKNLRIVQPNWYIPTGSIEIFTIFYPVENDPLELEKIEKTKESLLVTDEFGNNLKYSSEVTSGGNVVLKVETPRRVSQNFDLTLKISYKSYGLLIKSGLIRDLYIPSFSEDYTFVSENIKETVNTNIKIPKKYGEINFIVPEIDIFERESYWEVTVDQESLIGRQGWIQIGNKQQYTFQITQPYKKTTNIALTFNTYKIILPRDINSGPISQKVFFKNFSIEPFYTYLDDAKNLVGVFRVPSNSSGAIFIDGFVLIEQNKKFDFKNTLNISDIPKEFLEKYTRPSAYWESDSEEILAEALKIKGDLTNVFEIASKAYKYVIERIDYSEVKRFGSNTRQGALKTLQGGAAVCMEYSDLYIAILRAIGIPARAAFGYGYSPLDFSTSDDGTISHQWAEVYFPGPNQWIGVDTTWGESGSVLIGGDLNHFYTHVAYLDPETPSTTEVSFYGAMEVIPEKKMIVLPSDSMLEGSGISQEKTLLMYQEKDPISLIFFNILSSIEHFSKEVNKSIGNFLEGIGFSAIQTRAVKISLLALLFIFPLTLVVFKQRRKKF